MWPKDCPFCNIQESQIFKEVMDNISSDISEQFIVIKDRFPISKGHSLIVTKKDFFHITDLPAQYMTSLQIVIRETKYVLENMYKPDGFNIGINESRAAGQTIFHFHMHIIPRYKGDVLNPRGGIRRILPDRSGYNYDENHHCRV